MHHSEVSTEKGKVQISKVYKITELSETAQERAHSLWLEGDTYFHGNDNAATLNKFAEIVNVNIKDWNYGYHNYINYSLDHSDDDIRELSGKRLCAYLVNNYWDDITSKKYYSINGVGSKNYRARKSSFQRETGNCPLTGMWIDNEILQPMWDFIQGKTPSWKYQTFEDIINDCLQSWVSACQKDYESTLTLEYFLDHAEANEYEYDINGNWA